MESLTWRNSRALRILSITAAIFVIFAAVLLAVVRHDIVATVSAETTERVNTAAKVMRGFASEMGETRVTADGKLAFGSSIENGDTGFVDRVKEVTGADAGVYQVINGKPTRIATTLTNGDNRTLGAQLDGPQLAAFAKNLDFNGETKILGTAYIANDALIRDELGNTIGILEVSIPLTTMDAAAASVFRSILIVALIAIVVVLVALYSVTVPLQTASRRLARSAEALAAGRVDEVRLRLGQDELGRVAASFASIVAYQRAITTVAEAIADGDLSRNVTPASDDDRLGHAIARMSTTLRDVVTALQSSSGELAEHAKGLDVDASTSSEIVGTVGLAVHELASGSTELSHAAETSNIIVRQFESAIDGVARGAVDQAMQVRAILSDHQRMAADVDRVANITADLAATGQQTRTVAQNGALAVTATIADMREIERGVGIAVAKIRELGELSTQIGSVVETIDAVTDQTNLLALNAAIEAARAGEHGRGFAVVADEVRKLAESSQQQTAQIGALIVDVQRRTREAVEAAQAGAATVERGSAKVGAASEALAGIIEAVERVVERVGDIAEAMREMAAGARAVGGAMDSINAVVEENSSATEQMASQTGELARAIGAIAATADQNARGTSAVSNSARQMEEHVARVRGEAATLERTSSRLAELVSRFRLDQDRAMVPVNDTPPENVPAQ
jgi:methyl-accepting chemotaxis protein